MWHGLRLFLSRPIVWIPLSVAGLLNIASWFLLLRHAFNRANDVVVLHYSVYYGVDLVGNWAEAFWIPFVGLVFLAFNTGLAYVFQKRSSVVRNTCLIFTPVIQLLIFFAIFFLVVVNLPVR